MSKNKADDYVSFNKNEALPMVEATLLGSAVQDVLVQHINAHLIVNLGAEKWDLDVLSFSHYDCWSQVGFLRGKSQKPLSNIDVVMM